MKKSNNTSILGKYSDNNLKKRKDKTMPAMVSYEQRYRADSLAAEVTKRRQFKLVTDRNTLFPGFHSHVLSNIAELLNLFSVFFPEKI